MIKNDADYVRLFRKVYEDGDVGINISLKEITVAIVPGFFVNTFRGVSQSKIIGNFFEDAIEVFKGFGADILWLETQTEQSILKNSQIIIDQLKEKKTIIFLSHSRGCNDVLHALLTSLNLQKNVMGWISLQGLFLGSPISNFIEKIHLDKIYGKFLKKIGGSEVIIHEMTMASRLRYLSEYDAEIQKLALSVSIVSLGSFIPFKLNLKPDTFLKWSRDLMSLVGYENDGIVHYQSSLLPYSKKIILKNVDHIETVAQNQFRNLDRKKLTIALLNVLLS